MTPGVDSSAAVLTVNLCPRTINRLHLLALIKAFKEQQEAYASHVTTLPASTLQPAAAPAARLAATRCH